MGKNLLVSGGGGYIGSPACKARMKAGYTPIAYDSLVYGHRDAVRWGPLVEGDLADRRLLADTLARFEVAAVLHFAAFAYVGESMAKPQPYFQNNVVNTLTLLDVMLAAQLRHIVFSSSCTIYGTPARLPITEDMPQLPVSPYGESKLICERAIRWYGEAYGMTYAALRYFNAAGADPDGEIGEEHEPETHLVPLVLATALGRRTVLDVYGTDYETPDGTAVRDYIHVQDLAEAHVAALNRLLAGGTSLALNLGTGIGHSVREVIAAAERVTGRRVARREMPRRPGDPPGLVADVGRAREAPGWRTRMSVLDRILGSAWAWHARPGGLRATGD